jgi:hypothetical protein
VAHHGPGVWDKSVTATHKIGSDNIHTQTCSNAADLALLCCTTQHVQCSTVCTTTTTTRKNVSRQGLNRRQQQATYHAACAGKVAWCARCCTWHQLSNSAQATHRSFATLHELVDNNPQPSQAVSKPVDSAHAHKIESTRAQQLDTVSSGSALNPKMQEQAAGTATAQPHSKNTNLSRLPKPAKPRYNDC